MVFFDPLMQFQFDNNRNKNLENNKMHELSTCNNKTHDPNLGNI